MSVKYSREEESVGQTHVRTPIIVIYCNGY